MKEEAPLSREVDEFIRDEIDTIPHLEALLLVWNSRPKQWTIDEMTAELYVDSAASKSILQSLARRGLLALESGAPERYRYASVSLSRDSIVEAVDAAYRNDLIRISRMIHSNAARTIRDFAEAFRFKKDRE